MTASKLILYGLIAIVGVLVLKKTGILNVGPAATSAPVGGIQSAVPQSDLSAVSSAINSVFNFLTPRAQTAPKTT
jgi:hypothetical protein